MRLRSRLLSCMNLNKMIFKDLLLCPVSIQSFLKYQSIKSPISNSTPVSYACSMAQVKEEVEISQSNVLVLAHTLRAATLHRDKIRASENR